MRPRLGLALLWLAASCTTPDPISPPLRPALEVLPPSATSSVVLYRPSTPAPHPVVVWLHPGGWRSGTALLSSGHVMHRLVAAGYAVASIDYRLSTVATWPAQGADVRAGVRWLRDRADSLGLVTDRIGVVGYSAGGHLAAHLAARCDDVRECVQAAVAISAPVDFLTEDAQLAARGCPSPRVNKAGSQEALLLGALPTLSPWTVDVSPLTWITGDEPPFLIFHGQSDCTVPLPQAAQLYNALVAHAVPVQRFRYVAGHNILPVIGSDSTMGRIVAFLGAHL